MYLHEDKKQFGDILNKVSQHMDVSGMVIEKDYYVTIILKLLSQKFPFVVFKGGTSLSKCYKVIKRFSEDIDITIDKSLSQGKKKELKYAIVDIAEELGMEISNLEDTRSRRNYNQYQIRYNSVFEMGDIPIASVVLVETSFATISFPTVMMPVTNYISEVLKEEAPEIVNDYDLDAFEMKVQSLNRTLADKVFAICDYYLQNKINKHSRHIYDIYKLLPLVDLDEIFKKLVAEVREVRKSSGVCPSAQDDMDVPSLLQIIIERDIYKEDYKNVTKLLLEENISYETAVSAVEKIRESGMFAKKI